MRLLTKTIQKYSLVMAGGILFLADRLCKWLVVNRSLPYFKNEGLIFSLPVAKDAAVIITLLILVGVIWFWVRLGNQALLLIILGGFSNLFDRLAYQFVVDYIFIIPTAPANLADMMIILGTIIFILSYKKDVVS